MAAVVALLALEQHGRRVPLAHTRQPAVLRAVAEAALADVEAAADQGGDVVLTGLLQQEAERLQRAFTTLGLTAGDA
jgi:hypothetical protein